MDEMIGEWQETWEVKEITLDGTDPLSTVLFADNQLVLVERKDELQQAVHGLAEIRKI